MKTTLTVNGMHCKSCVMLVTEALEDAGAKNVSVKLNEKEQTGVVTLESSLTKKELTAAIEAEGDYVVQ